VDQENTELLKCIRSFQARGAKSRAKFAERREEEEQERKEDSRFRARAVPETLYRGPPVVSLGNPSETLCQELGAF
jgi:septal ring factor EnvC (AmiA/AmiB activator)